MFCRNVTCDANSQHLLLKNSQSNFENQITSGSHSRKQRSNSTSLTEIFEFGMAKDSLNCKSKIGSILIVIGVICTLLSMAGFIYDSLYSYNKHYHDSPRLKIENKKNYYCSDSNECHDVAIQINVTNNESLVFYTTNTTMDKQIQTQFNVNHTSIERETEDIKDEKLLLDAWAQKFNCQIQSSL